MSISFFIECLTSSMKTVGELEALATVIPLLGLTFTPVSGQTQEDGHLIHHRAH